MTEQNPWKRQLQTQRNATFISTTPSSVKNPQQTSLSDSPACVKKPKIGDDGLKSNDSPPWLKKKQDSPIGSTLAPWASKKVANQSLLTSTPQSGVQSNQPSWTKQLISNTSPNLGNIKSQIEKNKLEQETLRLQQQKIALQLLEKQKFELKRSIELENQQKKEKENQIRECSIMAQEDTLSSKREAEDLNQKKQSISRLKQFRVKDNTLDYESYVGKMLYQYVILSGIQAKEQNWEKKQCFQSLLIKLHKSFSRSCANSLKGFLEQKKIETKSSKFFLLGQLQIKYSVCESKLQNSQPQFQQNCSYLPDQSIGRKNCSAGEQATVEEIINKSSTRSKIFFDCRQIESLRFQFEIYAILHDSLLRMLKVHPASTLRVPLISFIIYKGVQFLCEQTLADMRETNPANSHLFPEILDDLYLLLESAESSDLHIRLEDIQIKKMKIEDHSFYFIYVKQESIISLISLSHKDNISLSPNSKQLASQKQEQLKTKSEYCDGCAYLFSKLGTAKVKVLCKNSLCVLTKLFGPFAQMIVHSNFQDENFQNDILYATAIQIVYSSCQGEVNEEAFFKLIVDSNSKIWRMIGSAFEAIAVARNQNFLPQAINSFSALRNSGFTLKCVSLFTGIHFDTDVLFCEGKNEASSTKSFVSRVEALTFEFSYSSLQIKKIANRFREYLRNDQLQLAETVLGIEKSLQTFSPQGQETELVSMNLPNAPSLALIQKEIQCLLKKKEEAKALDLIVFQSSKFSKSSLDNFNLQIIQLGLFIQQKEESQVLLCAKDLLWKIDCNFESDSILHAELYRMLGFFYSSLGSAFESISFYAICLSIAIKTYGEKSLQVAEIYLSRAEAFYHLKDRPHFVHDIDNASRIFRAHIKQRRRLADCYLLQGKFLLDILNDPQGLEFLVKAANLYKLIEDYQSSINTLIEKLERYDKIYKSASNYYEATTEILRMCLASKSIRLLRKCITNIVENVRKNSDSLTLKSFQNIFHQDKILRTTNLENEFLELENLIQSSEFPVKLIENSLKNALKIRFNNSHQTLGRLIRLIMCFYEVESQE